MATKNELPIITKKKRINLKRFVELAKKVRESFEEENRYLEKLRKDDENRSTRGILLNS